MRHIGGTYSDFEPDGTMVDLDEAYQRISTLDLLKHFLIYKPL